MAAQLTISGTMDKSSGSFETARDILLRTHQEPFASLPMSFYVNLKATYTKSGSNYYVQLYLGMRRTAVTSAQSGHYEIFPVMNINSESLKYTGFSTVDSTTSVPVGSNFSPPQISFSSSFTTIKLYGSLKGSSVDAEESNKSLVISGSPTVSFRNSQGSTVSEKITISVSLTAPKTGVKYTFLGNGGTIAGESAVVKTGIDSIHVPVAARGKSDTTGSGKYVVTFVPNNGSSSYTVDCIYTTTQKWVSKKYSRVDNKSITVDAETSYTVPDKTDRTWNAVWEIGSETSDDNAKLNSISKPERFGYTFNGWFKDDGSQVTTGPVHSSFTATAKWTPLSYKIRYKYNTVKNAVFFPDATEVDKTFGENVNITSAQPAAFGYTFKGWGTASECLYLAGTTSVDDKIVKSLGRVQNIELYAYWEPIDDTVITHNYSVNHALDTKTFTYNIDIKSYVVPEPNTRGGNWVFLGWYYEQGSQAPYTVVPRTKTKQEFWGNESIAESMGDNNFAWGTFKNPDIVENLTNGSIVSPMYLDTIKSKQLLEWNSIKSGNIQDYNALNRKVWGWEWHLYGFWTISGKFIKVGTKDDNEWKKVKSAYVKVINKDGEEDWKYISDLSMVTEIRGTRTPVWKKEVYK